MIVDALAFVGRHPFRPAGVDRAEDLALLLAGVGVSRAYVLALESLFHRNPWGAKTILPPKAPVRGVELVPLAGVNPAYALSGERLEDLVSLGFRGFVTSPSYHGYSLAGSAVARLLRLAADMGTPVVLLDLIEDERGLHRAYRFRYRVDGRGLARFLEAVRKTGARVLLSHVPYSLLERFAPEIRACQAYADVAHNTVYGPIFDRVARLVELLGADRVVFSSGAPFYYPLVNLYKILYSSIGEEEKRMLLSENALRFYEGG